MAVWPFNKLGKSLVSWLVKDVPSDEIPVSDIERIKYEIKPGDVLLVEGRNRISEIIKLTTRSNWSHAALYIGHLHDIKDPELKQKVIDNHKGKSIEHLLIEGILGKGTIVTSINHYKRDHLRVCRPSAIQLEDIKNVIEYAISQLGKPYNVKHIFDLLRLLFPVVWIPRHLFSTLFRPRNKDPQKQICSSLLAEAFESVKYPIIPKVIKDKEGNLEFIQRNPMLFTPKDFDYSPYFDIIKYPLHGLQNVASYRDLPWNTEGAISNDEHGISKPSNTLEE
jgi:hypothetical protein